MLCLVVVMATGCMFTYPVRQEVLPQPTTVVMIQPWPLCMGAFIPSAVRSRVFAQRDGVCLLGDGLTRGGS